MKTIEGYPGYFINDTGIIYSTKAGQGLRPLKGGLILGYPYVALCKEGKQKSFMVHRLVLEAYVGKAPKGYHACHNDGSKNNNTLSNLRWDTPKNNQADRVKHGTSNRGEGGGCNKLTEAQVLEIDIKLKQGRTQKSLAEEYGVNFRTINYIASRKRWGWLLDKGSPQD